MKTWPALDRTQIKMSSVLSGQTLLAQPQICVRSRPARLTVRAQIQRRTANSQPAQESRQKDLLADANSTLFAASLALAPFLADVDPAFAVKGEGGPLLEGRTVSLIHPATMIFLFTASLYAAYLGFQWRRTRTAPEQIKELKAQLPKPDSEGKRPCLGTRWTNCRARSGDDLQACFCKLALSPQS